MLVTTWPGAVKLLGEAMECLSQYQDNATGLPVAMSVHCHKSVPILILPHMLPERKTTATNQLRQVGTRPSNI